MDCRASTVGVVVCEMCYRRRRQCKRGGRPDRNQQHACGRAEPEDHPWTRGRRKRQMHVILGSRLGVENGTDEVADREQEGILNAE